MKCMVHVDRSIQFNGLMLNVGGATNLSSPRVTHEGGSIIIVGY